MPAAKPKAARKDSPAAVERLRRVALATRVGTPQRQIARELNCDEATVRRDRKKFEQLDSAQLEAILHGAPAEPWLRLAPADQEQVLQEVVRWADRLEIPPVRRDQAIDVVERCRPQPDPDLKDGMQTWTTWHAEWLLRWLPRGPRSGHA